MATAVNCGGVQRCSGYRVAVRWMSFRLEPYDEMRQYTAIVQLLGIRSVLSQLLRICVT